MAVWDCDELLWIAAAFLAGAALVALGIAWNAHLQRSYDQEILGKGLWLHRPSPGSRRLSSGGVAAQKSTAPGNRS
jgi:hypothetical protein